MRRIVKYILYIWVSPYTREKASVFSSFRPFCCTFAQYTQYILGHGHSSRRQFSHKNQRHLQRNILYKTSVTTKLLWKTNSGAGHATTCFILQQCFGLSQRQRTQNGQNGTFSLLHPYSHLELKLCANGLYTTPGCLIGVIYEVRVQGLSCCSVAQ